MGTLLSADDGPRMAESMDVVLARMDGKLDRVFDKIADVIPRVDRLEVRTDTLESATLILTKNAEAADATRVATALALREAEEARRNQADQKWTPFQRGLTLLGGCVAAAGLLVQYLTQAH